MVVNSYFYKIGYNTLVQICGRIISIFLGFISVGLLTRYLGEEGFGNFSLAFAYFSIFGIIGDWGLQTTMVRELAMKKNLSSKIYGTYFWIKIFLLIFSIFLALFLLLFMPYTKFLKLGIVLALFSGGLGVLNTYGTVIFQANLRLDLVTLTDLINKIVTVLFIIFFIYLRVGFYGIVCTILLGNFIQSLLIIILLKRFVIYNLTFDFDLAKVLFYKSVNIGFLNLLTLLYFKIDTLILSIFRNSEEIGIYSLSYKILENILAFWGYYMASVYPVFSQILERGDILQKIWKKSFYLGTFSSIIIFLSGFTFAPLIIKVLGGEAFHGSVIALRILLLGLPLFFVNNLFFHTLLVKEKSKELLYIICRSLIFNILFNIVFILKWGYLGAAITTIFTELFLTINYAFNFKKLGIF
jgi:O-antigen/teichoic acid export membrane protein